MSFIHENPVLVAPRPIRLAAAASHHPIFARPNPIRLLSPAAERAVDRSPGTDDARLSTETSPRPSPRSGLPSEALEEFLSILRPSMSMFPPNSPRRRTASTVPPWHYERSAVNLKSWTRLEGAPMKSDADDLDLPRAHDGFSPAPVGTIPEEGMIDGDSSMDGDNAPFRWFSSGVLSSPVSRMHTRNPFLRHAALQSPTPVIPLSPAAIPLPTPTPDELLDLH